MATKKAPAKKEPAKPAPKAAPKVVSKAVSSAPAKALAKGNGKPAAKPEAKVSAKVPAKPAAKPAAAPAKGKSAPAPAAKNGKPAAAPAAKVVAAKNGKAAPAPAVAAAKAPAAKNGKPAAAAPAKVEGKKGDGKTVDTKKPAAAKAEAKVVEAKKPEAKKPEPKKPESKKPESKKPEAKPTKAKPEPGDTPIVPKKGPIDLAQHKSVAEAAAAVANARGGTGEFIIINGRRVRAISTKGITLPKKSKSSAAEAAAAPSEQQIREIKTKLTKKELDEYRVLLHTKRRQLVGMLSGMEDEALRSSGGNLSNMPVHMADMGSDVYEQDFTLGMAETERAIITEIDAALQRIEDKTFGICQMTGKPISKARLDAKPWAKYTIEAERIAETSGPR